MKKTNVLLLAAAAVAVLSTGCSSTNGDRTAGSSAGPAVSTLSFVPSTDPVALTKWPREWQQNLRSIDIYTFVVPADRGSIGSAPSFSTETQRGASFDEAAGADNSTYYTPARVIRYSPSSH
jgi:hypothetical protein